MKKLKGKTHIWAGLALTSFFTNDCISYLGSILGAVLPDLDKKNSFSAHSAGFNLEKMLGHRKFSHSLFCFFLLSFLVKIATYPQFSLGFTLGYFSHLFLDMITKSGIPLFYPFYPKNYRLIGKCKTGGIIDNLFFLLAFSCFFYRFLTFSSQKDYLRIFL